jgi:ubiquinone/menaquinone biosynthesis C-methylase UbiE
MNPTGADSYGQMDNSPGTAHPTIDMSNDDVLYGRLAEYYDYVYHWKDYRKEVQRIRKLIQRYKDSAGNTLLDVACGTGKHLSYLQKTFDCVGLDISEDMLKVARKNAPSVELRKGDMTDFDLGRQFDVVLCLFSSIGHLGTNSALRKAISNFAKHTKKGGVVIVEPWLRKSQWRDGAVDLQTYKGDGLKIARVNIGRSEGAFSIVDEGYLIAERGRGLTNVRSRLKMRFFEPELVLRVFRDAGFEPRFEKDGLMPGRGLIIATKR